jgi:serine/threonine-protein kinase
MQLDHPGIVKVYDFGQNESLLYIIMEYIPGYNLRQARQYFKTLDSKIALPQVIRLFQEICLIVDYMHQQRVLHPGTKPENVMLKQGQGTEEAAWRPILINLGLLRPNKETLMSRQPITARRLTYTVSPELLLGHATDIRSDVYALGVLLYDLAVGEPPFRPRNLTEAVRFHVETPIPTPRSINPMISEELEAIILKACRSLSECQRHGSSAGGLSGCSQFAGPGTQI